MCSSRVQIFGPSAIWCQVALDGTSCTLWFTCKTQHTRKPNRQQFPPCHFPHAFASSCHHTPFSSIYSLAGFYLNLKAQLNFHPLWENLVKVFFCKSQLPSSLCSSSLVKLPQLSFLYIRLLLSPSPCRGGFVTYLFLYLVFCMC